MSLPLIDVVIPCYNTEHTLVRAVESVLQQNNLGHFWLIDDVSTDNTFALVLQLAEHLLDGLLFGKQDPTIIAEKMAEAEQVTSTICRRIEALKCGLNSAEIGIRPLVVERTE